MSNTSTDTKDPDATLDYRVDWTPWLATGDAIVASTWIVPAGITKTNEAFATTSATVWLSGGTLGQTYSVVNRITTSAGRADDHVLLLTVTETAGFTYTGNPAARDIDAVRFMVQDTVEATSAISDAEITFLLDQCAGSRYQAARMAAETLAAKFSGQAETQKKVGDLMLSVRYTGRAAEYRALAQQIAATMLRVSAPMPVVNPNALLPTADRTIANGTPGTDFAVGQMDNDRVDVEGNPWRTN